jgi:hypothetical protein
MIPGYGSAIFIDELDSTFFVHETFGAVGMNE